MSCVLCSIFLCITLSDRARLFFFFNLTGVIWAVRLKAFFVFLTLTHIKNLVNVITYYYMMC